MPPVLDPSQRAVIQLPPGTSASVLGAPGTGKTTVLIELVAERVLGRGWSTDEVLALTLSRTAATRLRDAIAVRLAVPTTGPLARTVNSLAFEVARDAARAAGTQPPRLVTGGEQDADIASLLAGHIEEGTGLEEGTGPRWPDSLPPEIRALRRFRTEMRELMMRATEYEVSPARLRKLGVDTGRVEWVAAADFIDEYLEVVSTARESQLDPSELARFAVAAIRSASPSARVDALKLVVIDDLQEATESTLAIVRALAARGVAIVAFGDPDVAANAFRGGEPDALGRLGAVLGIPAERFTLSTAHRQGRALREFTASVTARIGAAAAGTQRSAVAGRTSPDTPQAPGIQAPDTPQAPGIQAPDTPQAADVPIARIEATTPARAWAAVARELRERHLEHGVAWRDLAVVVRSGAGLQSIARSLALAEVPTRTSAGGTALREDPAARHLLTLVDAGIGRTALTGELATDLLLGPFGGLDRLGLRRLRLALRAEEVTGGGTRQADELLVEALAAPGRLTTIDHRVARAAGRLADTLAKLRSSGGSIEELLWIGWERSGLAGSWLDQALGGGVTSAEANRNLDGIVALFTAAKRFTERRPDAAPATFLAEVLDAEVPEDTLSPQAGDDAVLITTPSGTVGMQFDTVVVGGLQDGVWPNLRLRNSLLGANELVRVVTGIDSATVDERKLVLGDELRMFALAVSRARNRVVLAAVANDDESPSVFLSIAPPEAPLLDSRQLTPLTLRGITGRLRRQLNDQRSSRATRDAAASALAALAAERVPGADPAEWHGMLPLSTTAPLFEGERVPVSPSALEKLVDSPLDWFLETIAGGESGVLANVGTILHWAMETTPEPDAQKLWRAVESRWSELLFDAPWLGERQKRIAEDFTRALADYLADFRAEEKTLVAAEGRFELEVGNATVRGSIDRVERAVDGSVVIVDLKTGSPITSQSRIDEHPQLAAYQLAYAEGILDEFLAKHGEHTGGGAKLLFVKQGIGSKSYREGMQAPLTDEQLEEFRERIRLASTIIAAAEFSGKVELNAYGFGNLAGLRLHRVRAVSSD